MSEMLGNHYFQVRNFMLAEQTYENLSPNQLSDFKILKKLIICYTQTYKLDKALKTFNLLIEKDINKIIYSSRRDEDCPCVDLITKIEVGKIKYPTDEQKYTALAILWMYCNHRTSLNYFQLALDENRRNKNLNKVIRSIKNLSKQNILQTN